MNAAHVAIVVVNWNRCDDTLACLESLQSLDYPAYELIVVDNGSRDDSAARLRAAYPQATLIALAENTGFVGGSNQGIARARERGAAYVLLLNNDTVVAPDFLTQLVAAAQPADVGAVGPTIYFHDRPEIIWSRGGAIDWRRGSTTMLGLDESRQAQADTLPQPVDFASGCCLLIKTSVIERVGALDVRFFAYYEEVEWCVRIQRAGFRILHVPTAHIWHKIVPQQQAQSPLVHYYMTRNRLLFLQVTAAPWSAWIYALFCDYARTLASWSVRPKWRFLRSQRRALLRAVADYFAGRFGRAPEYEREGIEVPVTESSADR